MLTASGHPCGPQLRKASSLDPDPYRLSFGQTFCKPQRLGHFDMTGDFRPQGFWLGGRLATLDPLVPLPMWTVLSRQLKSEVIRTQRNPLQSAQDIVTRTCFSYALGSESYSSTAGHKARKRKLHSRWAALPE